MTSMEDKARSARVQQMFDGVSRRYDLINKLIIFGQDFRWRRLVVERARLSDGDVLLDLASGTGDLALDAKKAVPGARVVAADFSLGMMRVGRTRPGAEHLAWLGVDAIALPFGDASVDAVTQGYLLRNVVSIPLALAEQFRVLKPGGRVVVLDSSPPAKNIFYPFILAWMRFGVPTIGRLLSDDPSAYRYLEETTESFRTADEIADALRAAGFRGVQYKRFMFGTLVVHWAAKPRR